LHSRTIIFKKKCQDFNSMSEEIKEELGRIKEFFVSRALLHGLETKDSKIVTLDGNHWRGLVTVSFNLGFDNKNAGSPDWYKNVGGAYRNLTTMMNSLEGGPEKRKPVGTRFVMEMYARMPKPIIKVTPDGREVSEARTQESEIEHWATYARGHGTGELLPITRLDSGRLVYDIPVDNPIAGRTVDRVVLGYELNGEPVRYLGIVSKMEEDERFRRRQAI
jgi:hypothetical protein